MELIGIFAFIMSLSMWVSLFQPGLVEHMIKKFRISYEKTQQDSNIQADNSVSVANPEPIELNKQKIFYIQNKYNDYYDLKSASLAVKTSISDSQHFISQRELEKFVMIMLDLVTFFVTWLFVLTLVIASILCLVFANIFGRKNFTHTVFVVPMSE